MTDKELQEDEFFNAKPHKKQKVEMLRTSFATIELPTIYEHEDKEIVYNGKDNEWCKFMVELYNNSPQHAACINLKAEAIVGKGLILSDPLQMYRLKEANQEGDSFDEIFGLCAFDFELYGGFVLQVIWDQKGEEITDIYHVPMNEIATGKMNADGKVHQYWHSINFSDRKSRKTRFSKLSPKIAKNFAEKYPDGAYYDLSAKEQSKISNSLEQIYFCYKKKPYRKYYPLPDYVSARVDIQTDYEVSVGNLNDLSGGFMPGVHVNISKPTPDEEHQQIEYDGITEQFSGGKNRGNLFLTWSEKNNATTVTPISARPEGVDKTIQDRIDKNIAMIHRVPTILLSGEKNGTGLGNNANEIETQWQAFLFRTIRPEQAFILQHFQKIITLCGIDAQVSIVPEVIFANKGIIDTDTNTNSTVTAPNGTTTTETRVIDENIK